MTAGYGEGPAVLEGLDLELTGTGLVWLVGPNGRGKSTFVELASGYLRPRVGTVDVFGVPAHLPTARDRRRVCRSRVALFPQMTVRDHLAFGSLARAVPRDDALARAERLGLGPWLDSRAGTLSTGTARKAWIALCTVGAADLLLLDEPFDGLDADSRAALTEEIATWARDALVLLVSHTAPTGSAAARRLSLDPEELPA
ncbi:ABC transporter ATP-binding protein [Cellulomonas alba]|uniref:ATP-binding cassette domain-containing protein n=1 Tax=Cellulomonas alba TaxID=3053467 RepID=A0ABT7SEQ8_9CELL|nr:ATP-binding cassette domain-containing protein [Cellulomonas alba]MDM7854675.1 ATP-binding cassette domain-containing protein [Cellulomonas alba]